MDPPQDTGYVAYWSMFLLGAGVLAPWNAFITAVDYFEAVYPGGHMDRKFSVAYLPAMMVTLIIMIVYNKLLSPNTRVQAGLIGFTVILLLIPIIDAIFVQGTTAPPAAEPITLTGLFVVGIFDGICQGAVLGEATYLPSLYQQGYTSGTAASGVLISILRIVTKLALPGTNRGLRVSTVIYFLTSAMICFASLIIHSKILPTLPIVKYYKEKAERGDKDEGQRIAGQGLDNKEMEEDDVGLVTKSRKGKHYLHNTSKLLNLVITLVLLYFVTLCIFPGIPAEDVHWDALGGWYGILLIASFNLADFIGKSLPAYTPTIQNPSMLTTAAAIRLLFLPIFLLVMKFSPNPGLFFFLVFALGLTNGFFTSNAFIMAPKFLSGDEYDIAGNILILALVVGLVSGAIGGWGILALE